MTTTRCSASTPELCSTRPRLTGSPRRSAAGRPASFATTACSPSGGLVEEAAWWYLAMDRACGVQLLAEAAGTPRLIEPASAALTASQVGTPEVAKINFDCLWDVLLDEEPDFLD